MVYIKNHETWGASDKITTTILDNFETQYGESYAYLTTHNHTSDYYVKSYMLDNFFCAENDGSGSGADADLIYKSGGNLHAADFAGLGVATGLIIWWSDATVPDGWHICDGTYGTVDLRDRFVVGAGTGSDYAVGNTGTGIHTVQGTVTIAGHVLTTAEVLGHQHYIADSYSADGSGGNGFAAEGSGSVYPPSTYGNKNTDNSSVGKTPADAHTHSSTLTGDNFTTMPPYYALKFIQKLA